MKFLHLSAAAHGGAGTAALRIHNGLRAFGHPSHMLVLKRGTKDADITGLADDKPVSRYLRLLQKAWFKLCSRSDYCFQNQSYSLDIDLQALSRRLAFKPEVVVVHFISYFLSPSDVLTLQRATGAPVLWNLLDMGLFTGGCHYAWNCEGYRRTCGHCPALRSSGTNDLSARTWEVKHRAMEQTRGWVLAGSSRLARQASEASLLGGRHIETLLPGVPARSFVPGNRIELREKLGIGGAERVVFFGAQRLDQRRKGMRLLIDALLRLADDWPPGVPLPVLVSAGDATNFVSLRKKGFRVLELGFVGGTTLAKSYAAADIFACPSVEDAGPMMINESMMSGTPVVAFDVGVAEDLIVDNVTGIVAELGDIGGFADGMRRVLLWDDRQRAAARERCRSQALEKCSSEGQTKRLIDIACALIAADARIAG